MAIPTNSNPLGTDRAGGGIEDYVQDGLVSHFDSFLWGGVPYTWRDNSPAKCDAGFWGRVDSYYYSGEPRVCLAFSGGSITKATSIPITTEQFTVERTISTNDHATGNSAGLISTVNGVNTDVVRDVLGPGWHWRIVGHDNTVIGNVLAVRPNFDLSCYAITVSPLNNGTVSSYLNANINSTDVGIKLPPCENIRVSNGCYSTVILNVRYYNRALTQEELAHNWRVDRIRYKCAIIQP